MVAQWARAWWSVGSPSFCACLSICVCTSPSALVRAREREPTHIHQFMVAEPVGDVTGATSAADEEEEEVTFPRDLSRASGLDDHD